MKQLTTLPPTEAAPANAGATMPSPFITGKEHESDRREALLAASPVVLATRGETEAVVAEAERVATEARAKLQERENDVERLRGMLAEERSVAGNLRFFKDRRQELVAEVAGAEAMLDATAIHLHRGEGLVVWRRYIEHSIRLAAEAVHVERVLPLVEKAVADLQASRANLQISLGFKVTGLASDGTLEGSVPEPAPPTLEWRYDPGVGAVRLQPVGA
jgi:hypothetical protein